MSWLAAILWKPIAFIGILALTWWRAKTHSKAVAEARKGVEYRKTRREMDEALETMGDDPDVLRDYLRMRGQRAE